MDQIPVKGPEFLEHVVFFLRGEIAHAGNKEMFILFFDMGRIELHQLPQGERYGLRAIVPGHFSIFLISLTAFRSWDARPANVWSGVTSHFNEPHMGRLRKS